MRIVLLKRAVQLLDEKDYEATKFAIFSVLEFFSLHEFYKSDTGEKNVKKPLENFSTIYRLNFQSFLSLFNMMEISDDSKDHILYFYKDIIRERNGWLLSPQNENILKATLSNIIAFY